MRVWAVANQKGGVGKTTTSIALAGLLAEAGKRGIKLMLDIVVNHTSIEHVWFQQARSSLDNPYRDFYIWRDQPNNWESKFGGSAWEYEAQTGQYFLHLFDHTQADLNWDNPQVRAEVFKMMRFWRDKGVGGFRLDVINLISKPADFPEDTSDGRRFYTDGPRIHEFLQDVSRDVFAPVGVMTVGEMSSTSLEHCQRYGALDGSELSMVFNFHHLKVDYPNGDKWTKAPFDFLELKRIFNHWQSGMHGKGWSALFWCNHDQPRIVSRFGDDRPEWRELSAEVLSVCQRDPQEIGATSVDFLQYSAYVLLAGFWLQAAARAQDALEAGSAEAEFYQAKLQSADFYLRRVLPRASGHREALLGGAQCLMVMAEDSFAF